MDEKDFETGLAEILEQVGDLDAQVYSEITDVGIEYVRKYEDVGMLTNNKGVIVKMKDGSEFQMTIVQSR